jgi:UDP-N-acetylglucosamine 2-epimerase (non-hydrolysing)
MVLVQGDTASVFFGALVGYFEQVAVGHVEAGLRSGDMRRPFPEEGFRRLTSVLADLHFAPTPGARDHLLAEGIPPERVLVTGNPVVDALLRVSASELPVEDATLAGLLDGATHGAPFALLTAHRRESFGAPLEAVFEAVRTLVEERPELRVLYPVHPNPHVRTPAHRILGGHPRIHLVAPLSYPDLVRALATGRASCSPTRGASRRRRPPSARPCSCSATSPSAPRGSPRAWPPWWGPGRSASSRKPAGFSTSPTRPARRAAPGTPTATGRPAPGSPGRW